MGDGALAQRSEQPAHNRTRVGSNPTRPTRSGTPRSSRSGRGRAAPHLLVERSELEVLAELHRAAYRVSLPLGANARYDCIIDDGSCLLRVQIKTGFLDGFGAIRWATRSVRFYDGASRDYQGQADLFAVWVPETRSCYLAPVKDCGR